MCNKAALIIIDAQQNMFADEMHVYEPERLVATIQALAGGARRAGVPVIYVRNNGGPGDPDEPGTPGWEIYAPLAPLAGEPIVDKSGPDAFENTGLQHAVESRGIDSLILCGMQTELCIDATCRRAVELGYRVTVVADGHSTFDFENMKAVEAIEKYNRELGSIATVEPAAAVLFEYVVIQIQSGKLDIL